MRDQTLAPITLRHRRGPRQLGGIPLPSRLMLDVNSPINLPERFGLFTIIVLGEAVIATAMGASSVRWNAASIATASMGFAMATCIWWINFEFLEDDALKSRSIIPRIVYLYAHFFIVSSIVAIGIGVEHAIKDTVDAHLHLPTLGLLGGGIAIYLLAVTIVKFAAGVCRLLFARIVTVAFSLASAAAISRCARR